MIVDEQTHVRNILTDEKRLTVTKTFRTKTILYKGDHFVQKQGFTLYKDHFVQRRPFRTKTRILC